MKLKWALLVFVTLLIIVYVWQYHRYPTVRAILQSTLNTFDFGALLHRQPIVIQDIVQGLDEISRLWFPNNLKTTFALQADTWVRTAHKYTVVQPQTDTEVLLLHAGGRVQADGSPDPEETLTAVPLKAQQLIILPLHSVFSVNQDGVIALAVHDWVTRFLPR